MYLDNKSFGIIDVAIAEAWAEKLDDGQPKPSLKATLRRLFGREAETAERPDEKQMRPTSQQPLKNWR